MKIQKAFRPRRMCLYAFLGALMFTAKMALASLPNIEPVSLFVVLMAVTFGWQGLVPVYIYISLEFLFWGVQLWSVCYLYVWLVLFCLAMALKNMKSAWLWACLECAYGFSFGALCTLPYIAAGGWQSGVSWWISGIFFDLLHGAGNFILCLLLFHPLKKVLERLAARTGI